MSKQRPEDRPPEHPGYPSPVRVAEYCQRARIADAAEYARHLRETLDIAEQIAGSRLGRLLALTMPTDDRGLSAEPDREATA